MCFQAVSSVVKCESMCISTSALVLVCSQTVLSVVKRNQGVAQLLHLFLGAARLFKLLLNENQCVALVFVCCHALLSVVK